MILFNVNGWSDQGDFKILGTQLDCSWRFHNDRLNREGQGGLGIKDADTSQGQVEAIFQTRIPLALLWVVL